MTLTVAAAAAGAGSLLVSTVCTVNVAIRYEDVFINSESIVWCAFACFFLAGVLMTLAMCVMQASVLSYFAAVLNGSSLVFLVAWIMERHREVQARLRDETSKNLLDGLDDDVVLEPTARSGP